MGLLKITILVLTLTLLIGCSNPPLVVRGGVLTGNQQWQGRVELVGDVELAVGSTLTIAPGSEIVFHLAPPDLDQLHEHPHFIGSELIVRGRVRADGTPDAPIVFKYVNDNAPAGSWGGVNVIESPEARFSYVLFQSADSALHIQNSSAFIEHSIFRGNLVGVRFHSSQILIENNLFEFNVSGVRFHFGAPVICRNLFVDNSKSLFITAYPEDYRIENNHFISTSGYHVVLGEEVPDNVLLTGNWWGSTKATGMMESLLFDGRREPHLGKVLFNPALSGPLNSVGPGWN